MKSYIKLFLILGVLAGITACTDLNTDIKTQYTTYPNNPIAVKAKLEACYYYLRNEAGLFTSGHGGRPGGAPRIGMDARRHHA